MTSPSSPPNRRRRWIVVKVAVLVVGLGWWFWPRRVDQRFVGMWTEDFWFHGNLHLMSNGTAHCFDSGGTSFFTTWSFQDRELVFGPDNNFEYVKAVVRNLLSPMTGKRWMEKRIDRKVSAILPDGIFLENDEGRGGAGISDHSMKRVPE